VRRVSVTPGDRRRVVIRPRARAGRSTDVAPVFLPMVRDWQEMMASRYTDDELRLIVDLLQSDGAGPPGAPDPAARPGPTSPPRPTQPTPADPATPHRARRIDPRRQIRQMGGSHRPPYAPLGPTWRPSRPNE